MIGAGGMGEVWLAEDNRLKRRVAIKVLPPEFATDPERLARFEQEARAAAALNHPNIAAVFDVGNEGDTHYFVQEYLRGATLRGRLEQGTLSLERSLEIATGVARALSASHRVGIVHRDLKPENIFLTEEGDAKVLDFGLAKVTDPVQAGGEGDPDSPTELATMAGVILGTAGYMAPEQVEGQPVDGRTDLFAFGCLLYEMAASRRAFAGQSVIETMSRIVHEQPRPMAELVEAPPELIRIVGKCLAKHPRRRYQNAADLVVDLEALADGVRSGEALAAPAASAASASDTGSSSTRRWIVAGALTLLGAMAGLWLGRESGGNSDAEPAQPTHVTLVHKMVLSNDPAHAISQDGRRIAFKGEDEAGGAGLIVRELGDPKLRLIPGTEVAHSPFFSPDGAWIGFFDDTDRTLRKVSLATGDLQTISVAVDGHRGAVWTDEGTIIFTSFRGGVGRVSAQGGEPQLIASPTDENRDFRFPKYLPGGGDALLTLVHTDDQPTAARTSVGIISATGEITQVLEGASDPRYLDPGVLLFLRRNALHAVAFDLAGRTVEGRPVELLRGIAQTSDGPFEYAASRNGTLLYLKTEEHPARNQRVVVSVDRAGSVTPVWSTPGSFADVTVDPTGSRLAVQELSPSEGSPLVWLHDLGSGTRTLFGTRGVFNPHWSPSGEWIAAVDLIRGGAWSVALHRSDLSGERQLVETDEFVVAPTLLGFGTDDSTLFVQDIGDQQAVWEVRVDGGPSRLATDGVLQFEPAPSPDSRWMAFTSRDADETQVHVIEISTGRRWPVSPGGGTAARWRADGGELYYWLDGGLYAVPVDASASDWSAGPAEWLFTGDYVLQDGAWTAWSPSPDGSRFYLIRDDGLPGTRPARLELVLNFRTLVERELSSSR